MSPKSMFHNVWKTATTWIERNSGGTIVLFIVMCAVFYSIGIKIGVTLEKFSAESRSALANEKLVKIKENLAKIEFEMQDLYYDAGYLDGKNDSDIGYHLKKNRGKNWQEYKDLDK